MEDWMARRDGMDNLDPKNLTKWKHAHQGPLPIQWGHLLVNAHGHGLSGVGV